MVMPVFVFLDKGAIWRRRGKIQQVGDTPDLEKRQSPWFKNMASFIKKNWLPVLTALSGIEGFFCWLWFFLTPSSEKNALWMGLSMQHLVVDLGMIFILTLLVIRIMRWQLAPVSIMENQNKALAAFGKPFFRRYFLVMNGLVFFILGLILLTNGLNWENLPPTLLAVSRKLIPIECWFWLLSLQGILLLVWMTHHENFCAMDKSEWFFSIVITLVIFACLIQCFSLVFHIAWPFLYDQFVWPYLNTRYTPGHYLLLLLLFLSGAAYLYFTGKGKKIHPAWLAGWLVLLYVSQLAIAARPSDGWPPGLTRYQESPISHVLYSACRENPGIPQTLAGYDSTFKDDFWLGTKPPGYLIFYTLIRDGLGIFFNPDACTDWLPRVVVYLFPLFTLFTLWPLAKIGRSVFGQQDFSAGLLFFSLPNILYFTYIADQSLYPLLFTLTVFLAVKTFESDNRLPALLLGILLYIDVFISFSLIPILGFTGLWFLANAVINPTIKKRQVIEKGLWLAGGFLTVYLLFAWLGHYSPLDRYQAAFAHHQNIKNFSWQFGDYLSVIFLNNFEFVFWCGLPVIGAACAEIYTLVRSWPARKGSPAVLLAVCFLGTYIVLNLFGQTRGEVARLWMFLTPLWALFAWQKVKTWLVAMKTGLLFLQFLIVFSIFQGFYQI